MKKITAIRPYNNLFNWLLFFTGITFMLTWLPLLRCLFDGESYQWGQSFWGIFFSSKGLSLDYIFLVFSLGLYLWLYYAFYWQKNRKIFYGLIAWWFLHNFGNLLFDIWKNGDTMFHGDTLGVHVSLTYIIVPLSFLAFILIYFVIKKDQSLEEVSIPWAKVNKRAAIILLSPIPIQAILFATGEPHDLGDQIGVIIAIVQAIFFHRMFLPDRKFRDAF